MAEELRTLREAAIEIRSARTEMRIYALCAGFLSTVVISLIVWGFTTGFEKIDRLENLTVKADARLERMESAIAKVAADVAAIKTATKTASLISPGTFGNTEENFQGVVAPNDTNSAPVFVPAIGNDAPVPAN